MNADELYGIYAAGCTRDGITAMRQAPADMPLDKQSEIYYENACAALRNKCASDIEAYNKANRPKPVNLRALGFCVAAFGVCSLALQYLGRRLEPPPNRAAMRLTAAAQFASLLGFLWYTH